MNMNDPVQNLWLGKIQQEMGVQITNALLDGAKLEVLNHALTKVAAENEALKAQVQDMGQANVALRTEVARLTELLKPTLKKRSRRADG